MNDQSRLMQSDLFEGNRLRYGCLIRNHRISQGLTQRQLAQRVGVQKNAVSNWEAGRSRPDLDSIPALCRALGIPVSLFFGIPPVKPIAPADRAVLARYHRLNEGNRKCVDTLIEGCLALQEREQASAQLSASHRIFLNEARTAAGVGNPLDSTRRGEYVRLRNADAYERADEIIIVTGDSMEPTFSDGDYLLVAHTDHIHRGEIGIFVADGEGYVKEYQPDGLHSHNPNYPVLRFTEDDNVHCVGRVVGRITEDMLLRDDSDSGA